MPAPIALTETCCRTSCDEPESIQVPGAAGSDGATGEDGEDGVSPVTQTTAQFLMPAEGANVTVAVLDSTGLVPGQIVYVQNAGYMEVVSKPGSTSVILQNLENTASSLYTSNAAPTTAISAGSLISPGGIQGPANSTSGAAGGQLKGTYPNPKLSIANTKGKIIVGNGTDADELSVGTDGHLPHAASAQPLGIQWRALDLTGANTILSGALPIGNGGTGQVTANPAFNALSPVTTRGDMIIRNATVNARLPIGAAGKVLTSDGTDPSWNFLALSNFASSVKVATRHTAIVARETINLNAAAGSDTAILLAYSVTSLIIRRVVIHTPSTNLSGSAARFGIYTAIAKGGQAIVTDPEDDLTSLTAAGKWKDVTLSAAVATDLISFASSVIYFHLSAVHGSAATMLLTIFADDVSS